MSGGFRAAGAIGVIVLLVAVSWAGAQSVRPAYPVRAVATAAGGVEWLNVSVSDSFAFVLSTDEVTPGDLVHVVVTQLASTDHTFTLASRAGFQFDTSTKNAALLAYFASNPPLINLSIPGTIGVGGKVSGDFMAPPFGLYEYVCLKPLHFPQMAGLLGSGEHGSSLSTSTGPGTAVFVIVGVITGLVILALVLGFVVGKRRGAREEMPPERLGYSEPPLPPSH